MTVQLPPERHQKIKDSKKKNIQEKSDSSKNTGAINWDAFRYQNSIHQSISLSQMFLHFKTPNTGRTALMEQNN
jgi:hypothetical protein